MGVASALALAVGGGFVALLSTPGVVDGKLTPAGRKVFAGAARALLDGTMPADASTLAALLDRIDGLAGSLPPHAQSELSELLTLLASVPGRRAFTGLVPDWPDATVAQIQQGLQSMRVSHFALRRQAYQALHDITGAAYFSDPATWAVLGYPGPAPIAA